MPRIRLLLATSYIVFLAQQLLVAQGATSAVNPSLSAEEVTRKLQDKNAERASALRQFQGQRIYHMQYRGFPGSHDAEMVVTMSYQAPATKQFNVVSQSGSKFIIEHVFKKLLEAEQEAMSEENRQRTALNASNYDFTLAEYDTQSGCYVLNTIPKSKNKFLYRGRIWVDAKDFAIARIEAEPAKNPSFWIKKTEIRHRYMKVDDFWFPSENHSESFIRLGGKATLSIEYSNYKITDSSPLHGPTNAQAIPEPPLTSVDTSAR